MNMGQSSFCNIFFGWFMSFFVKGRKHYMKEKEIVYLKINNSIFFLLILFDSLELMMFFTRKIFVVSTLL